MVLAVDRSGWMMLRALVVKRTLRSVVIMDGEVTTVVTARTSLYRVLVAPPVNIQVSNFVCQQLIDIDDERV